MSGELNNGFTKFVRLRASWSGLADALTCHPQTVSFLKTFNPQIYSLMLEVEIHFGLFRKLRCTKKSKN
jgi:hypothetical protein